MQKGRSNRNKRLHPSNLHKSGYDFAVLCQSYEPLKKHLKVNQHGNKSIDFADPFAVKALNTALLNCHYGIVGWDIPEGFLCPPVPGRVDYIHNVAELLGVHDSTTKMLDIGTGANGIYSLLALAVYEWDCVASDIDPLALENVGNIVRNNPQIEKRLELRLQDNNAHIFTGIILEGESYDVSVCNPPFHASLEEAIKSSQRKMDNLARNRKSEQVSIAQNFGGQQAELWCAGGEIRFLRKMLKESKSFGSQCRWFTSLISKSENLKPCQKILRKLEAVDVREFEMKQGKKITRILAWTFMSDAE